MTKRHFFSAFPIIGVIIFAFILRLPLLNGSFWLDEAAQALESARPLSQQLNIVDDFQPPLLHLLVHFLLVVSRDEWWLRFGGALIPSLVTVWCTYWIGKKLFSPHVGLSAALLFATSSFAIFYAQELRPYAFPAMLASCSWVSLIKLMEKEQKKWWVLFTVLTVLGLYTSYIYPFFVCAQSIYLFMFQPKLRRSLLTALVVTALSFAPWLPSFLGQLHAGQQLIVALPGWRSVVSFSQAKSLFLVVDKFVFGVIHVSFSPIIIILSTALCMSIAISSWQLYKERQKVEWKKVFFVLSWLVLPTLFAWLVSFFVPVLQPKRVLLSLPAFYIVIASFLTVPKNGVWSRVLIGTILVINLFSTWQYYVNPRYQREDWRGLHQYILQKYQADRSIVVFSFPAPFAPWRWYDDGKYPTISTGTLLIKNDTDLSDLREVTQYQNVLVFDYLRDLTDPRNSILSELARYRYVEVDRITPVTPLGFVRIYGRSISVVGEKL